MVFFHLYLVFCWSVFADGLSITKCLAKARPLVRRAGAEAPTTPHSQKTNSTPIDDVLCNQLNYQTLTKLRHCNSVIRYQIIIFNNNNKESLLGISIRCIIIKIITSTKLTMKVQKIRIRGQTSWVLVGNDYLPIDPVTDYLQHLSALKKSPNTVKNYAHHLKLFWEFLEAHSLDWTECWEKELGEFMLWLQLPDPIPGVVSIQPQTAKRTERTINTIMSVVYQFYEFHARNSVVESREGNRSTKPPIP